MASRAQQAASATDKAARADALKTLAGEPLPLPSDRRSKPAELTPDLPAEIMALGACGLTETQIADHLCLTVDQLAVMGKACSAIENALSRARTAAQSWWEEQARRALITENNRFPAGAWAQVMKARFSGYDDRPTIQIDLGSLVVIQRAKPAELTGDQSAGNGKPLIEGRTVRLPMSPTVEGSPDPRLSDASPDQHAPDHGAPDGAEAG